MKSPLNILTTFTLLAALALPPYLSLWASSVSLSIREGRRVGWAEAYSYTTNLAK